MPPTCTITECKRTSCAVCHCCQQDICLSHLKEHQDLLISQLNPLVDQINILENRVNALNTANMTGDAREQLEQWRLDCHKKIDSFFEHKCSQLTQCANKKINKQREDIKQMRTKLTRLINEQEVTRENIDSLKYNIIDMEKEMYKTEQTSFQIQIHSGDVNDNLIQIEEINPYQFDLSSLPDISKTIHCSKENWAALATNDKYLLMYQKPNLCLVDQDCTIIKKGLWAFGEIWDMFWSSTLERFIVINENTVFLVDEDTMSVESIQMTAKQNWCCGTCSDKSLFLATYRRGASIMEFNLLPSIEFVKQWKSPDTCSKDEGIHDMIYNNEQLFLIIEDRAERTVRVELRSSITLDRLWSLLLDSADNQRVQIRCCLFNNNEWIIAYHDLCRLLHITNDGQLKASCSYKPAPHFASTFGSNLLVIATSNSVNLHQF
jgi:hypothetical protein